jgi:hypothetical protein
MCISLFPSGGSTTNMESENGHKQVNFVQYRRPGDRWQFVPVVRMNDKLEPNASLHDLQF